MNGHPEDSDEEVYLSEPGSPGAPEDIKTDDDYEYDEGGDSEREEAFTDAHSQLQSVQGSPAAPLPFDLGSIFKRAIAEDAAAAAPQQPAQAASAEEETEDSLAARVAASAVAAAVAANSPAASQQQSEAPRGLPGLPPKPKGGLGSLPPRPGGLGLGAGLGSGLPPRRTADAEPAAAAAPSTASAAAPEAPAAAPPRPAGGPVLPPRLNAANGASPSAAPMLFRRAQPAAPAGDENAAPAAAAPAPPAITSVLDGSESDKVARIKLAVQKFRTDVHRVALRIKYPSRASVTQQLMYRLGMAERLHLGTAASQQRGVEELAQMEAERAEVLGTPPLDFGCTVMVLGLQGVGKTATIHSLLGRPVPAGYQSTGRVEVVRGEVAGIPLTFVDTPGLEPSAGAIASNLAKLRQAKRAFNKYKPQAVFYVDRLDVGRRDLADLNVLRSITEVFGQDAWFSTVLVLTHGGSPPPDTSAGQPMTADMFYQQRGQQAQSLLRQVAGDTRLMNPMALAENSPSCPRSADGELVLPNGTPWVRHLLMLAFTTKVLNEANALLKPGKASGAARMQGFMGMKVPPLGWLLSRLVDFRSPRKPPEDEREIKRDDEIRALPPSEQAVQLRKKRMYLKQRAEEARADAEGTVPILAPEPALAPSFDADVTGYRYRVLEDPSGIIARPIVSDGAVDHEDGIDSVQVEKQTILRPRGQYLGGVPAVAWAQVQKDKSQFSFQGEAEGSYSHTSRWVSTAACNVQTIGRDVLYTPRVETRLRTGRRNKVALGALCSKLGEDYIHPFKQGAYAYGLKLDDRVRVLPNAKLRVAVGRMYTKAGQAYDQGTSLAADLKIKPSADETARILMGGTAVWQRRDVVMGGNLSTEFKLPKAGAPGGKSDTLCSMNAQYNNKGQGQFVLRLNSHDYPQLAAGMAVPVLASLWQRLFGKDDF